MVKVDANTSLHKRPARHSVWAGEAHNPISNFGRQSLGTMDKTSSLVSDNDNDRSDGEEIRLADAWVLESLADRKLSRVSTGLLRESDSFGGSEDIWPHCGTMEP